MNKRLEILERLWQRLPRPVRVPFRIAIGTLQRRSRFRRWVAEQIEQGHFLLTQTQLAHDAVAHRYHLPVERIAEAFRLSLAHDAHVLGHGDLILLHHTHPRAWLFGIWVHSLFRRGGIGAHLTQSLIALADHHSASTIGLAVAPDNLPALRLYESLDFIPSPSLELPTQTSEIPPPHILVRERV